MSAERKKLLWISIGLGVLVLIVLAAGFFLLAPKNAGAQAPATIGNSAPPKAQDPQDYLNAPPPAPSLEQPRGPEGDIVVQVYGDKPTPASSPAGAAGGSAAGSAAATSAPVASAPAATESPVPAAPAAAKKPQAPKAAAPTPKKAAPKAAPKAGSVKVDEYWIQVGSFTSRGRADELKDSLAEQGLAALITVKDTAGKTYYRVRIGPYSTDAEAKGWLARVKELPGCSEAGVWKSPTLKKK
jgi:DedD protein